MSGHESHEGNEAVHAAVRAYIHRAVSPPLSPNPQTLLRCTYILADYRHKRRIFPHPHQQPTRDESTMFIRLQTNAYIWNAAFFVPFIQKDYRATCNCCPAAGTLYHQVWEGQRTPDLQTFPKPSAQQRTARLTSKDPTLQLDLVKRAPAGKLS